MTLVWVWLGILVLAGAVFATVLAALEHWVAFSLFLVVYVIGVMSLAVQAVETT